MRTQTLNSGPVRTQTRNSSSSSSPLSSRNATRSCNKTKQKLLKQAQSPPFPSNPQSSTLRSLSSSLRLSPEFFSSPINTPFLCWFSLLLPLSFYQTLTLGLVRRLFVRLFEARFASVRLYGTFAPPKGENQNQNQNQRENCKSI